MVDLDLTPRPQSVRGRWRHRPSAGRRTWTYCWVTCGNMLLSDVRGNTNAPTIMIAERASDLIKAAVGASSSAVPA